MRKNTFLLLVIALIIPFLLFLFPVQRVLAIGPNFIEGPDGYQVTVSDSLIYNITKCEPSLGLDMTAGDHFQITLSKTNNSAIPLLQQPNPLGPWISDTVFGYYAYFNSTAGVWDDLFDGNETFVGGYNSTHPYTNVSNMLFGKYYYFSQGLLIGFMYMNGMPMMELIPNNFSAANHTIVNTTYTYFSMYGPDPTFNHTSPASINGTWEIWNGSSTTPTSFKYEFTFNASGFCTRNAFYVNSPIGWNLTFETVLLPPSTVLSGGFSVSPGASWTYTITKVDPSFGIPVKRGDKLIVDIITVNSSSPSIFPNGWIANTLYGNYSYYNSTYGTTNPFATTLIAAFNSIASFDNYNDTIFGQYNYYSNGLIMGFVDMGIPMLEIAPQNFTAANHTIVNMTYAFVSMGGPVPGFNHTSPGGIPGKWVIWNGTATDVGSFKVEFTLAASGICTRNALYMGGPGGWNLVYEATTAGLEEGLSPMDLLMLILATSSGGDQQMNDIIGIGITAGIFFIPLAIGLASKEGK